MYYIRNLFALQCVYCLINYLNEVSFGNLDKEYESDYAYYYKFLY